MNKDYSHEVVVHRANDFLRKEVHSINIESYLTLLKRWLSGIDHQCNKHLRRYVNEFTFRFNNRTLTNGSRFDVTLANTKGRLD